MSDNIHEQIDRLRHELFQWYQQGQYDQAIEAGIRVTELIRQSLGELHPQFAAILVDLAELYSTVGDRTQAESHFLQAIEIYSAALDHNSPRLARTINNLATFYRVQGKTDVAEQLYHQAVERFRDALDEIHLNLATGLNNLAGLYVSKGNHVEAERLYRQALEAWQMLEAKEHPEFASILVDVADFYRTLGKEDEAESIYLQALDMGQGLPEENNPVVASSLTGLVAVFCATGRHAQAEPLCHRLLNIQRSTVGELSPEFAVSLDTLADVYKEMGHYGEAETHYQQALAIRQRIWGEQHTEIADSLNNLGLLYKHRGQYSAAEQTYLHALDVVRALSGEQHSDFATCLNNLAALYLAMGLYSEAKAHFQRALEIRRATLDERDPEIALSLNNLAEVYRHTGQYAQAAPLYRQATDILRTALGDDHPNVAAILNNTAALYETMGSYDFARAYHLQALQIYEAAFGSNHPEVASSLNNLAGLYAEMGNHDDAERTYQRALDIWEATLGKMHPDYAAGLNNLAGLYESMNRYSDALLRYQEALAIWRNTLGKTHLSVASGLNNIATLYEVQGNYDQAEPLYHEALDMWRTILGDVHPEIARVLYSLAEIYIATGRTAEAIPCMEQAIEIDNHTVSQMFSIASESQRMAYLQTLRRQFEACLSFVLVYLASDPRGIRTAADLVLRRKAIGAEAFAVQRDAVLRGRDVELVPRFRELMVLRMQIAQKSLEGPGPDGLQAHQNLLGAWEAQRERLEAELTQQIPGMTFATHFQTADRHAVAQRLPKASALVEFVRFNVYNFTAVPARYEQLWSPARYAAFILLAGAPDDVQLIDLGEAEPIDQLIVAWRSAVTGNVPARDAHVVTASELEANDPQPSRLHSAVLEAARHLGDVPGQRFSRRKSFEEGARLRAAIFDPLCSMLHGCTQVFIAPDGNLAQLPFEALPLDASHYLIDTYHISYLAAGRDLMRYDSAPHTTPGAPPLVAADPDFNLGCMVTSQQPVPFPSLPGTYHEGRQVAVALQVEPLMREAVLKSAIKTYRSPRIVHIATHGFFLPDVPRQPQEYTLRSTAINVAEEGRLVRLAQQENPLLRSGLALAGANAWAQGIPLPPEAEDGILTAEDVTGLDLLDTELVVLSACETGLGKVQVGEGVFGLRRAFVLAGANTLVMSLWKVPDAQTQEFMRDFYAQLLAGRPCTEALRAAQLAIKQKYPEPFFWGGFICQGDPKPLPA
jgi:tetratricopeptide (TPR) repeat protein/CHAT domain-containing protein